VKERQALAAADDTALVRDALRGAHVDRFYEPLFAEN
jgi:hypothetical protein